MKSRTVSSPCDESRTRFTNAPATWHRRRRCLPVPVVPTIMNSKGIGTCSQPAHGRYGSSQARDAVERVEFIEGVRSLDGVESTRSQSLFPDRNIHNNHQSQSTDFHSPFPAKSTRRSSLASVRERLPSGKSFGVGNYMEAGNRPKFNKAGRVLRELLQPYHWLQATSLMSYTHGHFIRPKKCEPDAFPNRCGTLLDSA